MNDFNITIGDVTANTNMIEEDVIRHNLGLKPIEQVYQHQENLSENYFEELNDYLDGTMCV